MEASSGCLGGTAATATAVQQQQPACPVRQLLLRRQPAGSRRRRRSSSRSFWRVHSMLMQVVPTTKRLGRRSFGSRSTAMTTA